MKKALAMCLVLAALVGCAESGGMRHVRYPNDVTPDLQSRFNAAQDLYLKKDYSAADAALAAFVDSAPYTELSDSARFLRGEIAFARKDYGNAITLYHASFGEISSPKIEPKARFKGALAYARLSRPQDALTELSGVSRRDASADLRLRIDSLGASQAAAAGQPSSATVLWALFLLDDYAEGGASGKEGLPDEKIVSEAEAQSQAKRWIDDKAVTTADVEAMPLKEMKGKRSGGYALYKLALIAHGAGDAGEATKLLKGFISTYPKHEYYASARLLLTELGGAVGEGAGISVGVIVPLSGRFAVYGESVLHGIECAVGVRQPCAGPSGVRLVVRDSESFAGGAEACVEDLAKDSSIVAIVGPLQSNGALEAAQKAQELGIPLLSLSQREGVAEVGDYTFRNSASTTSEISTLVDYVMDHAGLKRFFIVTPNSRKAQEYQRLFTEDVKAKGGSIVATKSYAQKQIQPVNELRGRGAAEFGNAGGEGSPVELSAGAAYDAIFIPDAAWAASALLQSATLSGGKARLLGISRWNDPESIRKSGGVLERAIFVDSFYKGTADPEVSAFVTRFREAYNSEPTLLEALGYDTMRIVTTAVLGKGTSKRPSVRDAIARTKDFPGVAGKTSFDEQGDARRQMWVLTISGGQIRSAN